jgi:hypothetical protein
MAFDFAEFLELATQLRQEGGEAELRTAVSRAYFAAYGVACRYAVEKLGFEPHASEPGQDHGRLRQHYRDHKGHAVAVRLQTLREVRNACDYHDAIEGLEGSADDSLTKARYVIDWFAGT